MYAHRTTRAKTASRAIGGVSARGAGLTRDLLLLGSLLALLLRMGAGAG